MCLNKMIHVTNHAYIFTDLASPQLVAFCKAGMLMYTFGFMRHRVRANSWCFINSVFVIVMFNSPSYDGYFFLSEVAFLE